MQPSGILEPRAGIKGMRIAMQAGEPERHQQRSYTFGVLHTTYHPKEENTTDTHIET